MQQPATVEIPIEIGNKGFAPDDSIAITKVLGDRAVFETGGTYHVEGTYRLGSQPAALLAVYATNGGVMGSNHLDVARGQGTFSFDFKLVREGYPHVSLYPKPRGQSFGGIYFGVGATVYRGSYVPGP